jgi:hypothetical protein
MDRAYGRFSPEVFIPTVSCLDYRRLGKQRVECLQILKTINTGAVRCKWCHQGVLLCICEQGRRQFETEPTPWFNHPAVRMWRGYPTGLVTYAQAVCTEWKHRGYRDSCEQKILDLYYKRYQTQQSRPAAVWPGWVGSPAILERVCSSHRAALLAKDFEFYRKFGWSETPAINYYWPV